ncbi:AAA family ATPase [Streptomyces sp. NBRC 110028]|uniref:AAA family ATPase n=1 Tax=Streptomyces sp. NBRC 110028 TaxID=1621260 RepID=UPI0006E17618|nr:AAA family ATPase [Streptomyces sp. NBRC 110028]
MQHAVGAPLPPSHRPAGQGPGPQGAGWAQSASQPPGSQQHPPAPPVPPAPAPPVPPAHPSAPMPPGFVPPAPAPPAPAPPVAGHPQTAGHPTPQPPPGPPVDHPGTTGHIQLPPGGPVPLPHPPADPAMADASQAAVAVLLIGPAGAGKTTVARHWADRRRVPTAHISLDDVREWVRSGFANPQSGWNENSEAQYRLARRTCGFAARNFLANGISCILDDAVFPDRPVVGLGGWKRHVGPGLLPVVVLPGLEIVLERNAARSGNRRLSDEEVARIHGRMAGWYGSGLPIIDNSTYDVETTARMLDEVVARSIASPPAF